MTKKPLTDRRRALYGKIEIAKKALGLDEDSYRDLLQARFGKRSRTQMTDAHLVELVEHFKGQGFRPTRRKPPARAGRRRLADGRIARKARALWLSLYHLGVVADPAEAALAAFVRRQTGVDDAGWLTPDQASSVVEALKDWAARDGGVNWAPYAGPYGPEHRPRFRVMEAQWRRLRRLGAVQIGTNDALSSWVCHRLEIPTYTGHTQISEADADRLIERLGGWIRATQAQQARREAS